MEGIFLDTEHLFEANKMNRYNHGEGDCQEKNPVKRRYAVHWSQGSERSLAFSPRPQFASQLLMSRVVSIGRCNTT